MQGPDGCCHVVPTPRGVRGEGDIGLWVPLPQYMGPLLRVGGKSKENPKLTRLNQCGCTVGSIEESKRNVSLFNYRSVLDW